MKKQVYEVRAVDDQGLTWLWAEFSTFDEAKSETDTICKLCTQKRIDVYKMLREKVYSREVVRDDKI